MKVRGGHHPDDGVPVGIKTRCYESRKRCLSCDGGCREDEEAQSCATVQAGPTSTAPPRFFTCHKCRYRLSKPQPRIPLSFARLPPHSHVHAQTHTIRSRLQETFHASTGSVVRGPIMGYQRFIPVNTHGRRAPHKRRRLLSLAEKRSRPFSRLS